MAANRHLFKFRCVDACLSTSHGKVLISRDGTCLLLAERKYGGSQLDRLLQKDQVARIEFRGLRVRNQILRVRWRHDLIVLCNNQQRRDLDSRGILPNVHTKVNLDGLLNRARQSVDAIRFSMIPFSRQSSSRLAIAQVGKLLPPARILRRQPLACTRLARHHRRLDNLLRRPVDDRAVADAIAFFSPKHRKEVRSY
jgi:hypothetical protein